jgi:hypothetical protein
MHCRCRRAPKGSKRLTLIQSQRWIKRRRRQAAVYCVCSTLTVASTISRLMYPMAARQSGRTHDSPCSIHAMLPLLDVSKMLGHSSTGVTAKVYASFVQDHLGEIQCAPSSGNKNDASGTFTMNREGAVDSGSQRRTSRDQFVRDSWHPLSVHGEAGNLPPENWQHRLSQNHIGDRIRHENSLSSIVTRTRRAGGCRNGFRSSAIHERHEFD